MLTSVQCSRRWLHDGERIVVKAYYMFGAGILYF